MRNINILKVLFTHLWKSCKTYISLYVNHVNILYITEISRIVNSGWKCQGMFAFNLNWFYIPWYLFRWNISVYFFHLFFFTLILPFILIQNLHIRNQSGSQRI